MEVVTAALKLGCGIIPDLQYRSRKYPILETVKDYENFSSEASSFYLISDTFFRYPLDLMRHQNFNDEMRYSIYPLHGGPMIQLSGGGTFNENCTTFIKSGSLGYYSKFYANQSTLKAPSELVEMYSALCKIVKKSSRRIKFHKRVFWVGIYAQDAIRNGAKLSVVGNFDAKDLLEESQKFK